MGYECMIGATNEEKCWRWTVHKFFRFYEFGKIVSDRLAKEIQIFRHNNHRVMVVVEGRGRKS
jgi:hypothetical protein